MAVIKQLTPDTTFFIGGETSCVYQHNGGLVLIDGKGRQDCGFDSFKRHLVERIGNIPQFRWKLHEVPLGLDLPYWVEDGHFSFDHHIRRIAVPSPGDRVALSELVSYLYSKHMDRSRPLWETWFVEGLADGQFAVLQKLHHCMMDGEGATRLSQIINDFEPDGEPAPVDPSILEARPGPAPTQWQMSWNAARKLSTLPTRAGKEIADTVLPGLRKRISRVGSSKTSSRPPVPLAHFNGDISAHRAFVFGSLPLADIKAVKNHFEVSVNDVVLALVASTLRDYLLQRGLLPADSLRAAMAVSLRVDDDDEFSNKVTSTSVTLATAIADPVGRLEAIAEESNRAKEKARGGGKGFMEYMQMLPPGVVNTMMSLTPPDQSVKMVGSNLLVTSVRGSDRSMYMGGLRQTAIYPIGILTPGMGINVTCVSYIDEIDCGITVEPDQFPDPWPLIDGLNTALADYLKLCKPKSRPRRRKKTTSTARVKRKKRAVMKKPA